MIVELVEEDSASDTTSDCDDAHYDDDDDYVDVDVDEDDAVRKRKKKLVAERQNMYLML